MKRQVTKDITSYFSTISKKQANIQTRKDFLQLDIAIDQQVTQQTIIKRKK